MGLLHRRGLCFIFLFEAALLTAIINLSSPAESAITVLKNETDRLALLKFKQEIYGDPNGVLSSWNDSHHFCMWGGITCSRRHPQRVTVLNLRRQDLAGSLSPYIANLSFLRNIQLSFNNFQGHIPYQVGHLFRLRHLSLYANSFDGKIPSNLSYCSELRSLSSGANKLVGSIPVELTSLPKLYWLSLRKNNLSGHIPPSLSNLSSLTILDLSYNSLEGKIPESLGRIANLQAFAVSGNTLSGTIPSSLYNLSSIDDLTIAGNNLHGSLSPHLGLFLPNLRYLAVGVNRLTGSIPNSLGNASNITTVDISDNNFIGTMPVNLERLQALEWLNVEFNQLSGDLSFIDSLKNCSNLKLLSVNMNKFSGMLPNSLANLSTQLMQLKLAENQIFGNIPIGIDNLAKLIGLDVADNLLKGTIPIQLGYILTLQLVNLSGNRLSGEIPESLGNLSQLSYLYLQGNDLQGSIPQSLGNCLQLLKLLLFANDLGGTIPEQLFNVSTLVDLEIDMNSLTGPLPSGVLKLNHLVTLNVSNNKLSGELPSTIGNYRSLNYLYMEGNQFHGTIPSLWSSLKDIHKLDLSRNNLSGQVPKFLEELPFLQYLNLSFNNLEGEVPKRGIFQNSEAFSVLENDKLCGGIPTLKLPSCPKQDFNKHGKVFPLKLTISIVVVSLCVFLLSIFLAVRHCLRRPSKQSASSPLIKNSFLEVTYRDILKATVGFSSANLIGEGSYGFVYKGIIEHIEATVAIKVLKLQHRRASKSFIAECKVLSSIQHRNIVKVLTVCSSIDFNGNDFKAFVFQYMPNGNLDMWLHPNVNEHNQLRTLSFIQRINIAIDVACALDYLHHRCEPPVIHCDLKPSNILLDEDMVARVSDFGLARILYEDLVEFSSLLMKGSIGYLAPEYGMGGEASTYGDIYSYGIFLLEMFTGKRPTDDVFKDNLSIHQYAKMALRRQVLDIVDHRLLSEEVETSRDSGNNRTRSKMHECLLALVGLGVSCSSELPKERLEMKDVVRELQGVREFYLGMKKYQSFLMLDEGPSYLSN